ncbi:MAG: hypothetical protein ACYCST_04540 [Acidimicrobiales bacterium]
MKMPKRFQHKARHRSTLVGALFCASALTLALPSASLPSAHGSATHASRHHGLIPPANPRANIPPNPDYEIPTGLSCWTINGVTFFSGRTCISAEVAAISHARSLEHVGPLHLPRNWSSLSPSQQLFVVIDSERVARGLPPFVGLSVALDAIAQKGANVPGNPVGTWGDPSLPSSFSFGRGTDLAWACAVSSSGVSCPGPGNPGASIAIGGSPGPLTADYGWMYDDGWGGSSAATTNLDCTSPHAGGCWGHRDNILGPYPTTGTVVSPTANFTGDTPPNPLRTTLLMGAGAFRLPARFGMVADFAAIFLAMTGPTPKLAYTWADALAHGALGSRKKR